MSRHRSRTPNVSLATSAMVGVPAVLGATDPGSTRLVYAMVGGLVIIGLGFVGLGVWLVRQTRYDPPVLAPLERMGDRDWRKRDGMTQRRILDEVRPEGAEPLRSHPDAPELDAEFELSEHRVPSMTDLGPGLAAPPPGSFPVPIAPPTVDGPIDGPIDEPSVEAGPDQEGPVVEGPTDEDPADEGPADEGPADEGPAGEGPADEGPADEGPAGEDPADEDPAGADPAVEDPADEGPVVEGSPERADR